MDTLLVHTLAHRAGQEFMGYPQTRLSGGGLTRTKYAPSGLIRSQSRADASGVRESSGVRWEFWFGLGTPRETKRMLIRGLEGDGCRRALLREGPAQATCGSGSKNKRGARVARAEGGRRRAREPHLHVGLIAAGLCEDPGCCRGGQVPIVQTSCAPVCLQQG